jgi:hypothetical protein
VDEVGELQWVSDEKYRCVIANKVIIAFFSVEFDCKAAWISCSIGRTPFTSNGGKASEDFGTLADFGEEFGFGVLGYVGSNLESGLTSPASERPALVQVPVRRPLGCSGHQAQGFQKL